MKSYEVLYKTFENDFFWNGKDKNFNLQIDDDLKKYIMVRREKVHGIQYIFAFNNNFGLSVIKAPCTYGYDEDMWECAMLQYLENLYKYELYYCKLTNFDVLGYMSDERVNRLLRQVKEWKE